MFGIFRHPDKGRRLLPKNAKDPEPGHRLWSLTQVTRKAVRIAGGYSGTDIDVEEQAMLKVEGAVKKIVAAGRLAVTDPQSAMKILGYASHNAFLEYHAFAHRCSSS